MAGIKTFVLIFLSTFGISSAQYAKCDTTTTFTAAGQTKTISWPETNNYQTWCTYIFKAPADTYLKATHTIKMKGSEPYCSEDQYVAISTDNMQSWDGYSIFCGQKSGFVVKSIGNELKIGISADDFTQTVQIQIQTVQTTSSDCQCSWDPTMRIINGNDAGESKFTPHVTFYGKQSNFCGGTLITQYHAITAGHCIANINGVYGRTNVQMQVGRYHLRSSTDTVYAESYSLASATSHPNYNNPQNAHDIGIVQTTTYVRFTRGVSPACLPFSYEKFSLNDGTTLVAVGFGATEFGLQEEYDTASSTLQRVDLQTNSKLASDCGGNVLCLQGSQSGYARGDTCTRDSGGGVYGYMKNRPYFFAVISRGLDCGSTSSFSYNMYVASYISWIKGQVGTSFLCNF